jgi:hypothetical protein
VIEELAEQAANYRRRSSFGNRYLHCRPIAFPGDSQRCVSDFRIEGGKIETLAKAGKRKSLHLVEPFRLTGGNLEWQVTGAEQCQDRQWVIAAEAIHARHQHSAKRPIAAAPRGSAKRPNRAGQIGFEPCVAESFAALLEPGVEPSFPRAKEPRWHPAADKITMAGQLAEEAGVYILFRHFSSKLKSGKLKSGKLKSGS